GLLGELMGSYLGGSQKRSPFDSGNQMQGGNMLLQIALMMLQQNGGLEGVLGKFRQGGLAQQADSWVGTGKNMDVSGDQVQEVFGPSTMGDLASKLGIPTGQAGSVMAQILPELINQLTPQGQVPENSNQSISDELSKLANSARDIGRLG
ncbi:MAG TPA: YidB family protein, partial [Candidatus Binatia bacterium]